MAPATLPKPRLTPPAMLSAYRNGELPAELLKSTGFGSARAIAPAAAAFRAFAELELAPRGIRPRTVGGYRSLRGQWSMFDARYEPCTLAVWLVTPRARRKTWPAGDRAVVAEALSVEIPDATYWRKRRLPDGGYPATAAVPGRSNHGLGLAVDVAEERDGDPFPEQLSPEMLGLLIARGHLYGLGAEADAEPWHWRYYAGDNVPPAVRAYLVGAADDAGPLTPAAPAPTIRHGTRGDNVRALQELVNRQPAELGLGRLAVDGAAGPYTVRALRRLQGALSVRADGVYGPVTAAAVTRALATGGLR